MTRFQFKIPERDAPTRSAPALPVNVHRAQDFAIVSRSVTGRDVSLAPGAYVAVVEFPDGQQVSQTFQLRDDEQSVELDDVAEAIAAHLEGPIAETDWNSALRYDFIDFNPFRQKLDVLKEGEARTFATKKVVSTPSGDRWRYLAVAPRRLTATRKSQSSKTFLIAVPAPEKARVTITLKLDGSGGLVPDFVMPRAAATLLYRYLSEGAPERAARLAMSAELVALDLVENKPVDPVSGALGLYLLLNMGRVEEAGERSEKLYRYNPHLADGAIVYGEYLARMGHHEEAVEAFASVEERGIPVLTMGFRTALARLSTYIRAGVGAPRLSVIDHTLRYWANRSARTHPTTVIELDAQWCALVHDELATKP